jgi:hemolysin activation/secretion protein
MKTVDIAGLDGEGVVFGRADYDIPLSVYGVRFKGWGSAMHYSAAPRVAANSQANGEAFELGFGVMRPLATGAQGILDVQADFIEKFVKDRFDDNIVTGDKISHNGRIKVSGATMFDPTQILRGGLTLTTGSVDLSGLSSALAADRAGPKANGLYTKLEGEAVWQKVWDAAQDVDMKINWRGQVSAMNLDSMEKFSLGGMSGLRAFGSGEASGDMGTLAQFEAGYRLYEGVRASFFYDVGAIWRNFDPYEAHAKAPNAYMLQNVGLGLGYTEGPFSASLLFAQQIGANPGLSAAGRDADNATRESRILTTLSYAF